MYRVIRPHGRPRVVPRRNEGPQTTQRNEIRPLFALVKLALPLHKHYYIQLNLSNRKPLMSCLFTGCFDTPCIKSTFTPEIIYSIITTYQIWWTGVSISTNGNFASGVRATRFHFLTVLSAVSPFLSRARKSKPAERRDRSQSNHMDIYAAESNVNHYTKED
jgi:hypothetical protein